MRKTSEKKGIGKTKTGLIIFVVLAVILTFSNLVMYVNLTNQINSLKTDNMVLHGQMDTIQLQYDDYVANHHHTDEECNSLNITYNTLKSSYDDYQEAHQYSNTQYETLQSNYANYVRNHHHTDEEYDIIKNENAILKTPQLHLVNYEDKVTQVWLGTDYVTVKGTVFNSGGEIATNVVLTIRIYDNQWVLLETEAIDFGTIYGKSYENFDTIIYREGASYTTHELTYD